MLCKIAEIDRSNFYKWLKNPHINAYEGFDNTLKNIFNMSNKTYGYRRMHLAMKKLGFADVFEVAIGADLCAAQEAQDFLDEVPEKIPFMATSCCPAWSVMAKKLFPDYANCISMALTPMTLTARLIKKQHESAKVVFIGPCAAKKLEASDEDVFLALAEEVSHKCFLSGIRGKTYPYAFSCMYSL